VAAANPFEVLAGGRSHFRVEDLLQLATLMARQREAQEEAASRAGKPELSRK